MIKRTYVICYECKDDGGHVVADGRSIYDVRSLFKKHDEVLDAFFSRIKDMTDEGKINQHKSIFITSFSRL